MLFGTNLNIVRVKIEEGLEPAEFQRQILAEKNHVLSLLYMSRNPKLNNKGPGSKVIDLEDIRDFDHQFVIVKREEEELNPETEPTLSGPPVDPLTSRASIPQLLLGVPVAGPAFPPPAPVAHPPARALRPRKSLPKKVRPNLRIKYPVKKEYKEYDV